MTASPGRAARADEEAHERATSDLEHGRRVTTERAQRTRTFTAPYHWHTTHPDTGSAVVFSPGEALPPWAITGRLDELVGPPPPELRGRFPRTTRRQFPRPTRDG